MEPTSHSASRIEKKLTDTDAYYNYSLVQQHTTQMGQLIKMFTFMGCEIRRQSDGTRKINNRTACATREYSETIEQKSSGDL